MTCQSDLSTKRDDCIQWSQNACVSLTPVTEKCKKAAVVKCETEFKFNLITCTALSICSKSEIGEYGSVKLAPDNSADWQKEIAKAWNKKVCLTYHCTSPGCQEWIKAQAKTWLVYSQCFHEKKSVAATRATDIEEVFLGTARSIEEPFFSEKTFCMAMNMPCQMLSGKEHMKCLVIQGAAAEELCKNQDLGKCYNAIRCRGLEGAKKRSCEAQPLHVKHNYNLPCDERKEDKQCTDCNLVFEELRKEINDHHLPSGATVERNFDFIRTKYAAYAECSTLWCMHEYPSDAIKQRECMIPKYLLLHLLRVSLSPRLTVSQIESRNSADQPDPLETAGNDFVAPLHFLGDSVVRDATLLKNVFTAAEINEMNPNKLVSRLETCRVLLGESKRDACYGNVKKACVGNSCKCYVECFQLKSKDQDRCHHACRVDDFSRKLMQFEVDKRVKRIEDGYAACQSNTTNYGTSIFDEHVKRNYQECLAEAKIDKDRKPKKSSAEVTQAAKACDDALSACSQATNVLGLRHANVTPLKTN